MVSKSNVGCCVCVRSPFAGCFAVETEREMYLMMNNTDRYDPKVINRQIPPRSRMMSARLPYQEINVLLATKTGDSFGYLVSSTSFREDNVYRTWQLYIFVGYLAEAGFLPGCFIRRFILTS